MRQEGRRRGDLAAHALVHRLHGRIAPREERYEAQGGDGELDGGMCSKALEHALSHLQDEGGATRLGAALEKRAQRVLVEHGRGEMPRPVHRIDGILLGHRMPGDGRHPEHLWRLRLLLRVQLNRVSAE